MADPATTFFPVRATPSKNDDMPEACTTALDRAVGALVGLAVGDAVGTTLEFKQPGTFSPLTDMVGGGPFGLRPGDWTDDTSMALCLAESLLDTGGMDLADQLRRYVLWWRSGYLSSTGRCFDIGGTTRAELTRFERTGEAINPKIDQESAANGSLMRLAPVAIRWYADAGAAAAMSAESSRSTHAAQRPVDACRLLGAMTAALIGGVSADEVFAPAFWRWGKLHREIAAVAEGSWRGKEPPEIRGDGYCVRSLEAAMWAVGGASRFAEAVLRAANLGDDADTTAAIAGQLAGARFGVVGIPENWRTRIVLTSRIVELATGLFRAGGGDAPVVEWAHDDFIHAWWVEPGRVLAGEYPGAVEARVAESKVNLLVDAGVRTFVDLTTPADRLVPYSETVVRAATARRLDLRHHNIGVPDLDITHDVTYDKLIRLLGEEAERGAVYVHCWGGVGRTGTVIGALLIDGGLDYDATIRHLTSLRANTRKGSRLCPEVHTQHDVLRRRAANRPPSQPSSADE